MEAVRKHAGLPHSSGTWVLTRRRVNRGSERRGPTPGWLWADNANPGSPFPDPTASPPRGPAAEARRPVGPSAAPGVEDLDRTVHT